MKTFVLVCLGFAIIANIVSATQVLEADKLLRYIAENARTNADDGLAAKLLYSLGKRKSQGSSAPSSSYGSISQQAKQRLQRQKNIPVAPAILEAPGPIIQRQQSAGSQGYGDQQQQQQIVFQSPAPAPQRQQQSAGGDYGSQGYADQQQQQQQIVFQSVPAPAPQRQQQSVGGDYGSQGYADQQQQQQLVFQSPAPAPQRQQQSVSYGGQQGSYGGQQGSYGSQQGSYGGGQRDAPVVDPQCQPQYIFVNDQPTQPYCICSNNGAVAYGFQRGCPEGFGNPCDGSSQFFPANPSLGPNYFIHCSWNIPYLKICPATLVWNQNLLTCDWNNQDGQQQQQQGSAGGYGGY